MSPAVFLVGVLGVAAAAASPPAPPDRAPPAPPATPPPAPPAAQSPLIEYRTLPASAVASAYARLRAARDAERPDGGAVADTRTWSPLYATMSDRNAAGTMRSWHFEADGSGVVRRAYALSNRSGRGYGLLAEVACDDAKPRCAAFEARVRALPAPPPIHEAAFDIAGLELARTRYASWVRVLETETCVDHPPSPLLPAYPPAALREEAEGVAHVQLAFNRCGHVRDASVRKSSGNRHLDHAAVAAVRGWSMGRDANAGNAGVALLPVKFALDDAPAAPQPLR